jgi:aminoglycoside/choline kinase family phosphotransferase
VPPDLSLLHALVQTTGARVAKIEPMPGGASTRRYFRVRFEDGKSAVAMFVPDGDRPEEIVKTPGGPSQGKRWPFLEVRGLLAERGIRVPCLYAESTTDGWLLIEDLGEMTLGAYLEAHADRRDVLYAQAVVDLARAQQALASLPAESVVGSRAFDRDLLRWELDHFREWGLDARGHTLSGDDRAALEEVFDRLATRIAALPRGFVHRDYQSRNLMVVGNELIWLDFQDALLGPRAYDLVALLFDSYQELDREFVKARLDDYASAASLSTAARAELAREVDWVAVQRKLKDAGRFVFIDRVKHDSSFLPYVAPTLRKVAGTLDHLAPDEPDMARLRAILRRTLPEEIGA